MRSHNHAPAINLAETDFTTTHNEHVSEIPAVENLPLTPETRAELDARFHELVGTMEANVSQAERERASLTRTEKIPGSHEPGIKVPKP